MYWSFNRTYVYSVSTCVSDSIEYLSNVSKYRIEVRFTLDLFLIYKSQQTIVLTHEHFYLTFINLCKRDPVLLGLNRTVNIRVQ